MRVKLSYGRDGLAVDLPDERLSGVLRLRPVVPVPDPDQAVARALSNPIGTAPLVEIASGRQSATVVVCDVTRPVPNRLLLAPLLKTLEAAGISRDAITLLIATGLHRPNLGAELDEMIGSDTVRQYRVVNHAGRDDDSHRLLGQTRRGTPVYLDRDLTDSDLKILTGLVEPHLMAGYSGGRKVACPGVASWRTVRVLHSPAFLEQPQCAPGRLADNPLHHELVEIARMAGIDFTVNVTLDGERRLTGVFAGDLEAAHAAAVAQVDLAARVPIEAPAEVVVTTAAGYPLDTTFYQAVKGMIGALPAVKPGGSLIVAASLSEGIGGEEFRRRLFSAVRLAPLMEEMLESTEVEIDQWQIEELDIAQRRARILVYSEGLDAPTLRRCHVEPISSVEAGVAAELERHGHGARLLAIPDGPYLIPAA